MFQCARYYNSIAFTALLSQILKNQVLAKMTGAEERLRLLWPLCVVAATSSTREQGLKTNQRSMSDMAFLLLQGASSLNY